MVKRYNKTPLESFVQSYIKQNRSNLFKQKNYINKAIAYISAKIEYGDCETCNEPIINLHTIKNNMLTNTVYHYILNMGKKNNLQSLLRTKQMLVDASTCTICNNENM